MTFDLTPTQRAALSSLTNEQIIAVLGEILEPTTDSPLQITDDECFDADELCDALEPIAEAWRAAYRRISAILELTPWDREAEGRADYGDYLYEQHRDRMMERELEERGA